MLRREPRVGLSLRYLLPVLDMGESVPQFVEFVYRRTCSDFARGVGRVCYNESGYEKMLFALAE
jgi:hypothetical protein